MAYQIPPDLEIRVQAQISAGQFANEEEVLTKRSTRLKSDNGAWGNYRQWFARLKEILPQGEWAHLM